MARTEIGFTSTAAMTQFERDRLQRIKDNMKRMVELMAGAETGLIQISSTPASVTPRRRAQKPQQRRERPTPGEERRSSRLQNQQPVNYALDCRWEEVTPSSSRKRGRTGVNGSRCHGLSNTAAATEDDAWYRHPAGWKPEFGCADLTSAEAATDAAVAKMKQLRAEGKQAFIKLMSSSQVSGGFWCQAPRDIEGALGTDKHQITLLCTDKADKDPDSMRYSEEGSSTCWSVVFLPKKDGGGYGFSGGWRGFAIDQHLYPNDTVVFEVLGSGDISTGGLAATEAATEPTAQAAASAQADALAASDAEGASDDAAAAVGDAAGDMRDGSTTPAASRTKEGSPDADADADGAEQPAAGGAAVGGAAAVSLGRSWPQGRQHVRVWTFRAHDFSKASQEQQQEVQEAQAAAQGDDDEGDDDLQADVPLAKLRKTAVAGAGETADVQPAEAVVEQTAAACGDAAAAAAAESDGGSMSKDALPAGAADTAKTHHSLKQQQLTTNPKEAAAAAAATAASGRPQRKRKSTAAPPAAAAAAPDAVKAQAGSAGRIKRKGGSSSAAIRGAAADAVKLVAQPVNPSVMVPGPTEDEQQRNAAGGPFYVQMIMAHRVDPQSQQDIFLVRWEGFGPWWDEWVERSCLDNAPHTYKWDGGKAAMPKKFCSRK